MSARDQLNQLLASVSGFDLSLDANDSCQIKCANGLVCVVELMPGTERALGYIPLVRLPADDKARAATMQTALAFNLEFRRDSNLGFVYDGRMDSLVLCSYLDLQQPTAAQFDHWLSTLIKTSAPVQQRLVKSLDQVAAAGRVSGESPASVDRAGQAGETDTTDIPFQL